MNYITLRLPTEAWELLRETLEMDSRSRAFDPDLRHAITPSLEAIQEVGKAAAN